jgi:hypothetical protein
MGGLAYSNWSWCGKIKLKIKILKDILIIHIIKDK